MGTELGSIISYNTQTMFDFSKKVISILVIVLVITEVMELVKTEIPQASSILFGEGTFRRSLWNYNPAAYYGYGYRPYAGKFGGYLGFLG